MKYLLMISLVFANFSLFASQNDENVTVKTEVVSPVPKKMSTAEKKRRFYKLLVPAVEKVHAELMSRYYKIRRDMINKKNRGEINRLKKRYRVGSDIELLYALYPHPQSITIAQAAMESAWATSRFFREANNIFGMWSKNENEPRISAGVKRNGNRTIWLRKFDTIEDSVRAYYDLLAGGKAFKEFRKMRYQTSDVFEILKKLDKYSEIGHLYAKELGQVIRYNKLEKYDL